MEFKAPSNKLKNCTFYGKMLTIGSGSGSSSRVEGGTEDDRRGIGSNESFFPGMDDDVALMCLAKASRSDHGSLLRLNTKFSALIKDGYLYELRKQMGIREYWVYMVCDPRTWDAYDPYRHKWMTLPKIPCDECFHFADKESLTVGGQLLVFGRELFKFSIWRYDIISRGWSKCENMTGPRCLFASASFGTIAIIAGGSDEKGNILKSAELYDSTTGKWETLPSLHSPRKLCAGVFMHGKFYVIGGLASDTESLTCVEEFDLNTRKWRIIEGMYPYVNEATQAPPLVAVVHNELYVVEYLTNMVKKYNKENNLWEDMGRIPIRADTSNGWGLAFKAFGNALLVVGGHTDMGPARGVIVLSYWNPESGSNNGLLEWQVVGLKENTGVFVFNCAVMGC